MPFDQFLAQVNVFSVAHKQWVHSDIHEPLTSVTVNAGLDHGLGPTLPELLIADFGSRTYPFFQKVTFSLWIIHLYARLD